MLTKPVSVTPLKVATPLLALTVVVPPSVPPVPDWIVTVTDADELVTVLPAESRSVTTGWVVSGASEAPATGAVVRANAVAAPGPLGRIFPLSTVIDPEVKRRT